MRKGCTRLGVFIYLESELRLNPPRAFQPPGCSNWRHRVLGDGSPQEEDMCERSGAGEGRRGKEKERKKKKKKRGRKKKMRNEVHTSCCLPLSRGKPCVCPTQGVSTTGMHRLVAQGPGRWIAAGGRRVLGGEKGQEEGCWYVKGRMGVGAGEG